jgi:hypothetical protein
LFSALKTWVGGFKPSFMLPYYGDVNTGLGPLGTISSTITFTMVANRMFMVPFVVPESKTFANLNWYLNAKEASATGNTMRTGIYNANQTTRQPTTLISDLGTVLVDSTGVATSRKSQAFTGTLGAGLYYAAFLTASSTATMGGVVSGGSPVLGVNLTAGGTITLVCALAASGVTPGPFSGINGGNESGTVYGVFGNNYPLFVLL